LNTEGDLLVSHAQRISHIKFQTYWTKIFDYYGITKSKDDPILAELAKEDESLFCDSDFLVDDEPPKRVKIDDQVIMLQVLNGN